MFKYFLLLFSPVLLLAQKKMDPKLTEVWEPIPEVVVPGSKGIPPSDAIILFDGTSLSKWTNAPTGGPAGWTINSDGSNHTRASWAHTGRGLGNALESHPAFNHLDSPGTTSAVTYRVMITTEGSYTLYINRSNSDAASSSVFRTASSLTLMEISG